MMRKNTKLLTLSTAMVALTSIPAINALAATDNLNIQAELVSSPLAMTATQDLNFGAFTNSGAGGTVGVDTLGAGSYVGVSQIVSGPSPAEGRVLLTGNSGVNIEVQVTAAAFPVTHATNGQTMQVTGFDINGVGPTANFSMPGTTTSLPIGATLNVPAGRPPGAYTGTFTVNAIYN